jgi:hypothetical protein
MTTATLDLLDLDAGRAARREAGQPDGLVVRLQKETFTLPGELPLAVLDPIFAADEELVSLIRLVLNIVGDGSAQVNVDLTEVVVRELSEHPALPTGIVQMIKACLAALFGEEEWTRFEALRPSMPDMLRLIRGLWSAYGVGLGEALRSRGPSENAGTTSKSTSNGSIPSTRGRSTTHRSRKAS